MSHVVLVEFWLTSSSLAEALLLNALSYTGFRWLHPGRCTRRKRRPTHLLVVECGRSRSRPPHITDDGLAKAC